MEEYKGLKQIQEMFDAVPDEYIPTEEELQFLDERNQLEADPTVRSFEGIDENYGKLLEYGLADKLLKNLEFLMVLRFEHEKEKFMKSEFYRMFKDHKVVKQAYLDYIRRQNF